MQKLAHRHPTLANVVLAAPFLALLAINTWHHAAWGDELHAWGLTLASSNPIILFHNLHYEGHPGLWHIMLWAAALVSPSPIAMQAVHGVLAATTIVIVAIYAPFTRTEKMLLLLNYFIIFEYAVLARNYGMTLLLAMIYAQLRGASPKSPILSAGTLGLMANTNVYGGMLAGFLGLEYLWSNVIAQRRTSSIGLANLLLGIALFGALMAFSVATVWPPADIAHHAQAMAHNDESIVFRFANQLLRTAVAPFMPIDYSFPASFAFPGNLYESGKRVWISLAFLPGIAVALWIVFRKQPGFLAVLLATIAVAASFATFVYPSAIRHMGVVFVGFVASLWVTRMEAPPLPRQGSGTAGAAVFCLLAMGALGGCLATVGQWMRPFSIDRIAADWLIAHEPSDRALVGPTDTQTEPIAILLGRRFYALDCQCEDSYIRFLDRRDGFVESMIPERLEEAVRHYQPRPVVLLVGAPLTGSVRAGIAARGVTLTQRVRLTGAERDKEMTIFEATIAR